MPADLPQAPDREPAPRPPEPGSGGPEMSRRTMLLLGGVCSVAVLGVLGLTLLVGGAHARGGHGGGLETLDASAQAAPAGTAGGPVTVPPVAGHGSMTAVARLAARRIPLGALIRVPSSRPAGTVVRSYPAGGSRVAPGLPVTLYVSGGQGGSVTGTRVVVPFFGGRTAEQARATAAGLGLGVRAPAGGGTVTGQAPAPGTVAQRGSVITLTLGGG
ncbi:PASTA domain-containing protein [Actinomadura parmotrematis]|uniref:PASTA domain-containing protein n=1 Tax=Actinomadura parmotrematis TaxID=2864039 RepID=A0ABS7FYR6_9ACTN|nr:PASTA domain-containing protein [Actinomadura parmotrematis]MBW8485446.1 PASTA domain-containing protein [Actinomadura parmotrematis]